jgi:hypothetical protein
MVILSHLYRRKVATMGFIPVCAFDKIRANQAPQEDSFPKRKLFHKVRFHEYQSV